MPTKRNRIADRKNKSFGRKVTGTNRQANGETKRASCYGQPIKEFGVRFNVWKLPNTKGNHKTGHPATFPYQLAHDHIISWSNEGDTILDPFMGSGTTLVAAARLGRNAIGIELDESYYKIAVDRVKKAAD